MRGSLSWVLRRLRQATREFRHLPRTIGLVRQAAGGYTALWAAVLVVQGLLPAAVVALTKPLVDGLAATVRTGSGVEPVFWPAAAMAALLAVGEVLRALHSWVRTVQSERVQDHIQSLIHRKSAAVDLAFYDCPDFYDRLHRAREESPYRPLALIENLGGLTQSTVTLVAIGAVLLRFGWWLPLALVASTAPALGFAMRAVVEQHRWRCGAASRERRSWYLDWLISSREAAPELRVFGLGGMLRRRHESLRRELREERLSLARRHGLAEVGAGVAGLSLMGAVTVWLVFRTIEGQLTLGDLALFYPASQQGLRLMRTLLDSAAQIYANVLYLGNLFDFLDLHPGAVRRCPVKRAPLRIIRGIRFRDVVFRYPGGTGPALRGADFTIPAGSVTAVVGSNGAGKSTVLKLLCGFYHPDVGAVEVDGVDLREFSPASWRRRLAVQFQEPVRYSLSAAENLRLGRPAATAPELEAAARAAGIEDVLRRLPKGYDSLLGRWFADGTELSAGQWHRLAVARTYVRQAPVILLDEPTSAMDPWSELEWMERFRQVAAGRTALIITHRLTTARLADWIHVMDQGRIVESGPHELLLSRAGPYSSAWAAQGERGPEPCPGARFVSPGA